LLVPADLRDLFLDDIGYDCTRTGRELKSARCWIAQPWIIVNEIGISVIIATASPIFQVGQDID
jgi:hypothetical protein